MPQFSRICRIAPILAAAVALLLAARSAQAGPVFKVSAPTFVAPGQAGAFFEVYVEYEGTGDPFEVVAYQVGVEIVGGPGVTITGVTDESTFAAGYLLGFPGSGAGGPTPAVLTDTELLYFDITDFDTLPSITLSPGDIFGLGRVYFDVAIDAFGPFEIRLSGPIPVGDSDLTDLDGNPVLAGVVSGGFSVVPEPAGVVLLGLGGALALLDVRRRRAGVPA